jgi:hypothetical protein
MEGTVGQVQLYKAATTVVVRLHGSMSMLYAVLSQVTIYGFRFERFSLRLAPNKPCVSLVILFPAMQYSTCTWCTRHRSNGVLSIEQLRWLAGRLGAWWGICVGNFGALHLAHWLSIGIDEVESW